MKTNNTPPEAPVAVTGSRRWIVPAAVAAILIIASILNLPEWIRIILGVMTMTSIALTLSRERSEITIQELWNAMPRDVQQKTSCHDLKRICDNLNSQHNN